MKEITQIKDALEDKIKEVCGEITPGKRLAVILVVIAASAALNIYLTVSSIYNSGKRKAMDGLIEIEHVRVPGPKGFRFDSRSGKKAPENNMQYPGISAEAMPGSEKREILRQGVEQTDNMN